MYLGGPAVSAEAFWSCFTMCALSRRLIVAQRDKSMQIFDIHSQAGVKTIYDCDNGDRFDCIAVSSESQLIASLGKKWLPL